ncbi:MAG: heat-inducible transcriptional repressor HrcA [Acholeplasmataceae bacterium]
MITNRQKLILKAIIEIYMETGLPVGSKILTDWPYLDYSSATIRYDMQVLEEYGYLEKTHTSSGRIPSKLGYRYYLDNLVTRDSNIDSIFPMIDQLFEHERNKETTVKQAIDLLSELTSYTSIILGPNEDLTRIKKIDFVHINENEAVILIVTDKGHVQSQTFKINGYGSEQFKETINTLDDLLRNKYLKDAKEILSRSFMTDDVIGYMRYQDQIIDAFVRAFTKMSEEDVYLAGLGNMITQSEIEDPEELRRLLHILDRKDVLKVIGRTNKLSFKIGREAEFMPTDRCTIISVPYAVSDEEMGTIAIIGPTRMDYAKVIPLMEYIAKNITKLYKK